MPAGAIYHLNPFPRFLSSPIFEHLHRVGDAAIRFFGGLRHNFGRCGCIGNYGWGRFGRIGWGIGEFTFDARGNPPHQDREI